eukprot:273448_1
MGICAANSTTDGHEEPLNYAQDEATKTIVNQTKNTQQNIALVSTHATHASTHDRYPRKKRKHNSYRLTITKLYIAEMQQLLYATHDNQISYRIPSTVTALLLVYLPTYFFKVYGIGKDLISTSIVSDYERLHVFEPKLCCVGNISRGHNKFFIKSFVSEIYGVGSNSFDGLCLNCDDFEDNDYIFKHINTFYKYLDFVDQNQSIALVSDSMFSNDIIIKLQNGSIYQSSLTMNAVGDWKRVFTKAQFDDLSMNIHVNITHINCGLLHSLFLSENGAVYSQGGNINGQCGLGYISQNVHQITNIALFGHENAVIKSINCGQHHSAAVDVNGGLWCFGYNKYNQCGLSGANTPNIISKPIMVFNNIGSIVKSECGESFTVYITDEGVYGGFGKMIVSTLDRANITEWEGKDVVFRDVSCGFNHVLLIGEDNKVYAHGSNEFYKCGLKTGRAGKPTLIKYDKLPSDLQPSAVIAGINNSVIIFSSTVD